MNIGRNLTVFPAISDHQMLVRDESCRGVFAFDNHCALVTACAWKTISWISTSQNQMVTKPKAIET